jgi:endonuclease/exonuclease/phosphatase family metal-dependent hydrolase
MRRLLALLAVLLLPSLVAPPPAVAAPPTPYALLQLNLCLSGLAGCFPGTQYPAVVEEAVQHITQTRPDAVTLNEACSVDVQQIAVRTGMEHRFATVLYRGAPLPCVRPGGRGVFGNAVLVEAGITGSADQAFTAQAGVEQRRWLCVETDVEVRVCTSHLSVAGTAEQQAANDAQCAELSAVLEQGAPRSATVFAGDVNRLAGCAPKGSWTVTDEAAEQAPGIQHAYGTRGWLQAPRVRIVPMTFTDHDGLLVEARLRGGARRG